jgi:hypothetical protein
VKTLTFLPLLLLFRHLYHLLFLHLFHHLCEDTPENVSLYVIYEEALKIE